MLPIIREIQYGSHEYRRAVQLRHEVLREPLGLTFSEEQLAGEVGDIHIAAFDGAELVGCAILTQYTYRKIKMRQVAILPQRQGQGIGRRLIDFSEQAARGHGFSEIMLHARESAVSFYEKLGYQIMGDMFIEVTLPHRAMIKAIE